MALSPIDWNVVVIGRWNRAILTPAGIGKRLFGVAEGTPLEVMLAIDAIAPPRVAHEGIVVTAGSDRLIIQPSKCTFAELGRARELARKALRDLPETPVSAVGLNVKYKLEEPLDEIVHVVESSWDNLLSDKDYRIRERSVSRSLAWDDASINIGVSMKDNSEQFVQFNFDFRSDDVELHAGWLETPIETVEAKVKSLLNETMEISLEELPNEEQV